MYPEWPPARYEPQAGAAPIVQSPQAPAEVPPSDPKPPFDLRRVVIIFTLVVLGSFLAGATGGYFAAKSETSDDYKTPPECIQALDLASAGFGQLSEAFAGAASLDATEITDANVWIHSHLEAMGTASESCRAQAE